MVMPGDSGFAATRRPADRPEKSNVAEGVKAFSAKPGRVTSKGKSPLYVMSDEQRYRKMQEQLAARFEARPRKPDPPHLPSTEKPSRPEDPLTETSVSKSERTGRWLTIGFMTAITGTAIGGFWHYHGAVPSLANPTLPLMTTGDEVTQALQRERDKVHTLVHELDTAWRALRFQSAQLADKTAETQEIGDLRQALRQEENVLRGYHELLVQELNRNTELEGQLAAYRGTPNLTPVLGEATPENVQPLQLAPSPGPSRTETVSLPSGEQPLAAVAAPSTTARTTAEVPSSHELKRLLERAAALLVQGNVAAARNVLERAAETRDAVALFALAETYDPTILSAWGTFGTQGDAAKARDLYVEAFAGGMQQAKDRLTLLGR